MTSIIPSRPPPGALVVALAAQLAWHAPAARAREAPCAGERVSEGRVASIIDARTFRMTDGREVRLAGVEDAASGLQPTPPQRAALDELVNGRDIVLRGPSKEDRYGRIAAFAYLQGRNDMVQARLLENGHLLVTAAIDDPACAQVLRRAEARARQAKRGIWAEPAALKNTEMPGDILAVVGQFVVAEGRVQSVREAGATLYINFGRRWTQDFAVTISRRNMAAFEAAGVPLKSLERRRLRVRGWVEQRGGPRIHASWAGQIEVVGN
jgi:endonuclease YncB( thermonuclease family)